MTKVEEAISEIDSLLATFAPQHEGLRDYAHLVMSNHTMEEVNNEIGIFDRRVTALINAKNALQALMNDGHPRIKIRQVDQGVVNELVENAATIEAAKVLFASNAAKEMTLSGGKVSDKEA